MTGRVGGFAACRSGAIAPIFACVACSAVALAGIGIDYGSALAVRSSLQAAVDGTVTAVELRPELIDDDLRSFARRHFEANLGPERLALVSSFAIARDGDGVRANAEAVVSLAFGGLLGVPRLEVRVEGGIAY